MYADFHRWFIRVFLYATTHLYKRVCLSVRPSVGPSSRYILLNQWPKNAVSRPAAPCSRIWCRVFGLVFYTFYVSVYQFPSCFSVYHIFIQLEVFEHAKLELLMEKLARQQQQQRVGEESSVDADVNQAVFELANMELGLESGCREITRLISNFGPDMFKVSVRPL